MARIAVVDDDAAFLSMLDDVLVDEGHQVIKHSAGDTVYAMIRKQKPDVVVLDMRMEHPEGGWMVLDRIRLEPETAHIPVIICSGDSHLLELHGQHLIEEGACILQKPFHIDDLLLMIANMLDPATRACGAAQARTR